MIASYRHDCTDRIESDPINHPAHYCDGGIEVIDYIKAKLTKDEFVGYLKGTVFKYLSRAGKKNSASEDYKKAKWFLDYLANLQ